MYTLEKQANTVTLSVDELIGAGDHYNTASQSFGTRLAQQARELERELGLDLPEVIEAVGFDEHSEDQANTGIEDMFLSAGIFGVFDAELLDELEDHEQHLTLDSVSKLERHGIYAVDSLRSETITVDPADYDQGNGQYSYVGDGAIGRGKFTTMPDLERARKYYHKRTTEPAQMSFADIYRAARDVAGIDVPNKYRQAFQRYMKKQTQSPDLNAFLEWAQSKDLSR